MIRFSPKMPQNFHKLSSHFTTQIVLQFLTREWKRIRHPKYVQQCTARLDISHQLAHQNKPYFSCLLQTYISLILWLCMAAYLIVTSTYVQKTNRIKTQVSKEKTTTTTTNLERTRRSVCSCAACNGKRTMPSRIPFGAARKVGKEISL